jgi:GMP synthase-like glutamine amidotransferase
MATKPAMRKGKQETARTGTLAKKALRTSKKLHGEEFERAVEEFQAVPDNAKAHKQWKRIETSVFGVQFED